MSVTLAQASSIVDATLKKARELKQMPQTIVVLDTGRPCRLRQNADNHILGAVGISGDTGDNDEIIALAGIEAAGLKADAGGAKK